MPISISSTSYSYASAAIQSVLFLSSCEHVQKRSRFPLDFGILTVIVKSEVVAGIPTAACRYQNANYGDLSKSLKQIKADHRMHN